MTFAIQLKLTCSQINSKIMQDTNSQRFLLSHETLSIDLVTSYLKNDGVGAIVTFIGYVRSQKNNKRVVALDFEAYEPMAIKELSFIAEEIAKKWPVVKIALHHRLGKVESGEVPVIAAAASPHRKDAFEACEYLMNRLKESVPIWKKEIFEDGEVWVTNTP